MIYKLNQGKISDKSCDDFSRRIVHTIKGHQCMISDDLYRLGIVLGIIQKWMENLFGNFFARFSLQNRSINPS